MGAMAIEIMLEVPELLLQVERFVATGRTDDDVQPPPVRRLEGGQQRRGVAVDMDMGVDPSEGRGVQDAVNAPKIDATTTYDGFDEPTKVSEKAANQTNSNVTTYQYDTNANATQLVENAVLDPNGNTITNGDTQQYTYTGADWLQKELDQGTNPSSTADDRTILWTYDGEQNPLTQTIQNGSLSTLQQSTWTYYANGLRKTLKTTGGPSATLLEQDTLKYVDANGIYQNGNLVSDQFTLAGPNNTACKSTACTAQYGYAPGSRIASKGKRSSVPVVLGRPTHRLSRPRAHILPRLNSTCTSARLPQIAPAECIR